jgi:hypothetical protein
VTAPSPAPHDPGPADRIVRRVAAHGLPVDPGTDRWLPGRPLPDDGWADVVRAARREGVTGPLLAALASGTLAATEMQARQAEEVHTRVVQASLRLEQALVDLAERFERTGIEHRVLKGPAIAHLDELAPWMRGFGDVDVLVHPDHLEAARDLLVAAGGRRRFPEPRPGYDRRFGKGICVVVARGVEVDLHRTLCPGPFGLALDPGALFAGVQTFTVAGRELPALTPAGRFLHACYHAALGSARARLVALRDVALTAPTDPGVVAEVRALAAAWRGEIVVTHACTQAAAALGWTPPSGLDRWEPTPARRAQRRWLAAYLEGGRSSIRQSLYGVEALARWPDRFRYLAAVLTPGPGARRWRRASRKWARAVRWRGRFGGDAH